MDTETLSWSARFAAAGALDGDEWDEAQEKLKADWLAAYTKAFVEVAMTRGWNREDAESCPPEIGDEAFLDCHVHGYCPQTTAALDVVACEEPV